MLEAAAVPVLLKAVDWIFSETSKFLDQRRELRKLTGKAPDGEVAEQIPAPDSIRSREAALSQPIEETLWTNAEGHVKHLLALLETYTKNYHLAREQYAKWGSALAPPILMHNIDEAEHNIIRATRELQETISTVYRRPVANPALELP